MRPKPPIEIERVQIDGRWVFEWSVADSGGMSNTYNGALNDALIVSGERDKTQEPEWRFVKLWRLTLSLARGSTHWTFHRGLVLLAARSGAHYEFKMSRHGAFLRRRIHLPNLLT